MSRNACGIGELMLLFTALASLTLAFIFFVGSCVTDAKADPQTQSVVAVPTTPSTDSAPAAVQVPITTLPSELVPWRQPDWMLYRDLLISRCLDPGPEYNVDEVKACGDALQILADTHKGIVVILQMTKYQERLTVESARPKPAPPASPSEPEIADPLYPFPEAGR